MAYRSTSIEVRPNLDVNFYETSDDHKAYVKETYEDTSKSDLVTSVRSGDDLTRTKVRNYDNKDSYGGRRSSTRGGRSGDRSPRGWERDSSRRNLGTEFDASKGGGLSDSYRIPRSSGSVNWSDRGSSTRRDSMHDNKSRSRGRLNSSSRGSSSRSGGGGGGLSATWGGNRGR